MDILLAPIIIASITMVLAFIIMIINHFVNNYGEVTISLNDNKKELVVLGGDSLLDSLSAKEIFIPSACGGRGSCGACKCIVTNGVDGHLPTETPHLTPEEIKNNTHLACQVKVKNNMNLLIPDELFNVKKISGQVLSLRDLTHDIKELTIDLLGEELDFEAGMYVQLQIPKYGKIKEENQRAYSIASAPDDKGLIKLIIRLVPDGIATTWVHNYLKEGDSVDVIGPFGEFKRHEETKQMICIAGGSGMAPFTSILSELDTLSEAGYDIWYFFGARTEEDLFYLDELHSLDRSYPNFHFIPALSEPEDEKWQGDTGLITDVLDDYLTSVIPKNTLRGGYLCGSPGMIEACIRVLTKNEVSEEMIFYDKF